MIISLYLTQRQRFAKGFVFDIGRKRANGIAHLGRSLGENGYAIGDFQSVILAHVLYPIDKLARQAFVKQLLGNLSFDCHGQISLGISYKTRAVFREEIDIIKGNFCLVTIDDQHLAAVAQQVINLHFTECADGFGRLVDCFTELGAKVLKNRLCSSDKQFFFVFDEPDGLDVQLVEDEVLHALDELLAFVGRSHDHDICQRLSNFNARFITQGSSEEHDSPHQVHARLQQFIGKIDWWLS